jgi:hypothetical protein
LRDEARDVLESMSELWRVQRGRVEHYGDEQGLEQAFIGSLVFSGNYHNM